MPHYYFLAWLNPYTTYNNKVHELNFWFISKAVEFDY
jgi:hypothetical protein